MSIINEALKKAQKENLNPSRPAAPHAPARNLEVEFERRKPDFNWGPIFVVLVLVLISGPILAPVLSGPFRRFNSPITAPANQPVIGRVVPADRAIQTPPPMAVGTPQAQFGIEEMPMAGQPAALYPRPSLSLSGVVVGSTNEPAYCIINNQVLKIGEAVQGARLVSINGNEVVLDFQGEKIILPVAEA